MKRIYIFVRIALFAALCGAVAGCENDRDDSVSPAGRELSFMADIDGEGNTRVAGTAWGNDMIGVFMTGAADGTAMAVNKCYRTASDGIFNAYQNADRIVLPEGATVNLYAYYPYNAATSDFGVAVNIADQSDQGRLDLLHAMVENVSSFTPSPTFTFTRQTVRLVFNVRAGQGITSLGGLGATVSGVPTRATFDAKSGAMSIDRNSAARFDANVTASGTTARVEVTLLPDANSAPTVSFILGGAPFVWTADKTLKKGWRYTYDVVLTDLNGGGTVSPANKFFETPILPQLGADFYFYELDLPDRQGRNYQMLYDTDELIASWVAYPMYSSIMGSGNRTDAWAYDPNLPAGMTQQNLSGSYGGGYDRGHQLPSADRNYNTTVNRTTFYYTNMTPQVSSMNQGIWSSLEGQVRTWAKQCDTLYVVTGAVLATPEKPTIAHVADKNGRPVGVPQYYYKALVKRNISSNTFHAIAFKIANSKDVVGTPFNNYRLTVAELEQATGITFFPQLPDPTVKNTIVASAW